MSTDLTHIGRIAGQVTRQEFGAQQVEVRGETAAAAVAAREQAAIQARFVMAMRNPRDIEAFRVAMLDECRRPSFAAVARYAKPIGRDKVYGPSIRFIEAAIRNFRNLAPEVTTVYDSPDLRIVRVSVTDLEANIAYATEIQIEKTIERRGSKNGGPPDGREVLGERRNSYGDPVYIVRATEDELAVKQAALVSKAIRTQAQRLLPGDIVEECMATVIATQAKADAQDPASALRRIIDAFHSLNVEPPDLERWAGKPIDRLQPKELQELREIYAAIREGEATWDELIATKYEGSTEEQKKVAQEKLAALLNRGKQKPAPVPEMEQAEVGAIVQTQVATRPEEQENLPEHQRSLLAYREKIGGQRWVSILGAHGYESFTQVPEYSHMAVLRDMEQALQERRAEQQAAVDDSAQRQSRRLKL
jgi:hypothetical protein